MNKDLVACLDGYRQSGTLQSEGEFTLSLQHADSKLQDYRLPEARLYVLNLVAAAVAGGASRIEISADTDDLYFTCDLCIPDLSPLESVKGIVFTPTLPRALKELAIGLNGALQLKPARVTMTVWNGQAAIEVRHDKGDFVATTSDKPNQGEAFVKVHVRERTGLRRARKLLASVGGGMLSDSEEDAIYRYCNRSPVPITFNGESVTRPLILGREKRVVFGSGPLSTNHPLSLFTDRVPSPGAFSGILTDGGKLAPWVTFVVHGVNFRMPEQAFERLNLRGVVYADFLMKDLSQSQLVQNEQFTRLLEDVAELSLHLGPQAGAGPYRGAPIR